MKTIDLRFKTKFNSDLKLQFDVIAEKYLKDFNYAIDKIGEKNLDNISWWMSNLASRNIQISNLYYNFCCTILLKNLINKNNKIDKIIVDSKLFKKFIESEFKIKCIVFNNTNIIKSNFLKIIFNFLKNLICYFLIKTLNNKIIKNKNVKLIDIFLIPNFYFTNRYFPNLIENLEKKYKKNMYYLPSFTMTSVFKKILVINKLNKNQFIIKENYLKFFDYIRSLFLLLRPNKINLENIIINNINFKKLFISEYISHDNFNLRYEGLLNYFFILRFSKYKNNIELFVNWWENQPIDKGYNLSLKKFYPKTKIKAYLGFVPRKMYMHWYPTKSESISGVVPKLICTIGDRYIQELKIYNFEQIVNNSPAFRYNYLFNSSKINTINKKTIFIALPMLEDDALDILKEIKSISDNNLLKHYKFLIKPHPTLYNSKSFKKINFDNNFIFVDYSVDQIISETNIIITRDTSISLELFLMNKFIIILKKFNSFDIESIPENIQNHFYKTANNYLDLITHINEYEKNIILLNNRNHKLLNKYFIQPNNENILEFLT
tara:strand:+ start:13782 stop:15425 length:1644 start_codon:yes stop_codon:yes gene_type:complete